MKFWSKGDKVTRDLRNGSSSAIYVLWLLASASSRLKSNSNECILTNAWSRIATIWFKGKSLLIENSPGYSARSYALAMPPFWSPRFQALLTLRDYASAYSGLNMAPKPPLILPSFPFMGIGGGIKFLSLANGFSSSVVLACFFLSINLNLSPHLTQSITNSAGLCLPKWSLSFNGLS